MLAWVIITSPEAAKEKSPDPVQKTSQRMAMRYILERRVVIFNL